MARGSGPALSGFLPGEYLHQSSGVQYRVFERDGAVLMAFSRGANTPGGALMGDRQLQYFVGSGERGRTFLYSMGGEWFELPINYYGRRNAWGMAPRYDGVTRMPGALPVDANCLHCHATGVSPSATAVHTQGEESSWSQSGIGCSACHGDPARHLAQGGAGPIVNPAELSPARRDSACIQCHLEGDAVVYREGQSLAQFRPGDLLSDYAVYFVKAWQASGGARANSQYEALLQSACKRASGDRLTCTTCHDAHGEPAPQQRAAYYRARCLQCHASPALALTHHPEQQDCASCHMPQRKTADISHEQLTDHDIERKPSHPAPRTSSDPTLVAVGSFAAGDRELGLAYAQLAERGEAKAAERALQLLQQAEQAQASQSSPDADSQLHLHLAFLEQTAGQTTQAEEEYARALAIEPYAPAALGNLATLSARSRDLVRAEHLLDRLVTTHPGQTAAGLNLIRSSAPVARTRLRKPLPMGCCPLRPITKTYAR